MLRLGFYGYWEESLRVMSPRRHTLVLHITMQVPDTLSVPYLSYLSAL